MDLGKEDSWGHRGFEPCEGRQGCRKPYRQKARRGTKGVARALFRGEGLSLSLPGCHLPEGTLGSKSYEHGATLTCVGVDEEGLREVLAIKVAGFGEGSGVRLAAARSHRPGHLRSEAGSLRRPRGDKGCGFGELPGAQ